MNTFLSGSLLAASMLLGQAGDPPAKSVVPAAPAAQQPAQPSRPIIGWFTREDRPVVSKIQGWFKRDQKETPKGGPFIQPKADFVPPPIKTTPGTQPSSNDFPRKLPNPATQSKSLADNLAKEKPIPIPMPEEVEQATLNQTYVPKNTKSPILAQLANKMGRDEKFEWITGQLEIENGNHVVYYATPETVDKFHGRIVILPQGVDLGQFKKGDLVSVRGTVAQRQTAQGLVPIYRVTNASLIERPKGL